MMLSPSTPAFLLLQTDTMLQRRGTRAIPAWEPRAVGEPPDTGLTALSLCRIRSSTVTVHHTTVSNRSTTGHRTTLSNRIIRRMFRQWRTRLHQRLSLRTLRARPRTLYPAFPCLRRLCLRNSAHPLHRAGEASRNQNFGLEP